MDMLLVGDMFNGYSGLLRRGDQQEDTSALMDYDWMANF